MLEKVDTSFTLSELSKAKELIKELISVADDDLGCTSLMHHTINTGDEQPICQRPRCLPSNIQKYVSYLVICCKGVNTVASPIVLIQKKDGKTLH